jgi:hypothetical protein
LKLALDHLYRGVDSLGADRSFLTSPAQTASDLLSVEDLASTIFLNDSRKGQLDPLIGGKAIATILTLTATANSPTIATRVSYRAFV